MSSAQYPTAHAASVTLRPERKRREQSWLDRFLRKCYSLLVWPFRRLFLFHGRTAAKVISLSETLSELSEEDFLQHIVDVRSRLVSEGITSGNIVVAFAMIREASGRVLGMRHHHTQIRVSLIMLQGMVAEMATGEGKTLAGTLASITAALAGVRVHVVTTNDYLAQRDCDEMLPLFEYLGLVAGAVVNESTTEERQILYGLPIVYCSNNELVFDYLKDLLVLKERKDPVDVYRDLVDGRNEFTRRLMHQGLVFAIVDEADSVLVDESRTPLIISGGKLPTADSESLLRRIMSIAQNLEEGAHYRIDLQYRRVFLLKAGRKLLDEILLEEASGEGEELNWHEKARGEELLLHALGALHLYQLDKHYIVDDGEVSIVDEYTGRLAADRSWEGGLHQMIEIKENCELTEPQRTLSKISYQQFFRKYFYLSGMTGTAQEVNDEFYGVYGLLVNKVPLLKRSQRRRVGYRVLSSIAAKEKAIVHSATQKAADGRAVLVGTASVGLSERLAQRLDSMGQKYELLTAKQDKEEADIVSRAGESGRITIATSMAGRGTDIKLSDDCRSAGGLHVIISELQDARRIDRQLEGRCARQGDPGTVEYLLSYEDPLVVTFGEYLYKLLLPFFKLPYVGNRLGNALQRYGQWRLESKHRLERDGTLKSDERERGMMAFLGEGRWT